MSPKQIKAVVDLNIILDVLQKREPHFEASARVWKAAETGEIAGFLAAHTVTMLFYLVRKSDKPAQIVADVLKVFSVAMVDQAVIEQALALGWSDFEDAVLMRSAESMQAQYLITRNPKDFKENGIKIISPAEFVALL